MLRVWRAVATALLVFATAHALMATTQIGGGPRQALSQSAGARRWVDTCGRGQPRRARASTMMQSQPAGTRRVFVASSGLLLSTLSANQALAAAPKPGSIVGQQAPDFTLPATNAKVSSLDTRETTNEPKIP